MDFGFVGTAVLLGYFAINVGKIIRLHRSHKCHQRYKTRFFHVLLLLCLDQNIPVKIVTRYPR